MELSWPAGNSGLMASSDFQSTLLLKLETFKFEYFFKLNNIQCDKMIQRNKRLVELLPPHLFKLYIDKLETFAEELINRDIRDASQALLFATNSDLPEFLTILIECGAGVNNLRRTDHTIYEITPLMLAASKGLANL